MDKQKDFEKGWEEWQQMKNSLYYSKEALEKKLQKARKETAEKFAEMVKSRGKWHSKAYILGKGIVTQSILIEDTTLDEIAKEITEGKV